MKKTAALLFLVVVVATLVLTGNAMSQMSPGDPPPMIVAAACDNALDCADAIEDACGVGDDGVDHGGTQEFSFVKDNLCSGKCADGTTVSNLCPEEEEDTSLR